MTLAQTFADFATGLTIDAIPEPVKERARHLILDSVGTGLAAVGADWAEATSPPRATSAAEQRRCSAMAARWRCGTRR
ncbi:MmgE/PrpD family protein [Sphingomonas aerolata]|uniref:MmgE/PrpD family protein n=1 Tax=Sphingomonas aerolata TaxID=185951 RepID=UPI003A5C42D4